MARKNCGQLFRRWIVDTSDSTFPNRDKVGEFEIQVMCGRRARCARLVESLEYFERQSSPRLGRIERGNGKVFNPKSGCLSYLLGKAFAHLSHSPNTCIRKDVGPG